ncbi:MAG: response regulator, partial [Candidatus Cloacimonadaceae bacterium]|nr:response regulator [Candidatus Cloacimonadaceae bacterium]
ADPSYVPTLECRIHHLDGSWKWIEATFSNLLEDIIVHGIVINFRDISERKHAENIIKESEARYRHLIETMNEVVVYVDNDDVIKYINPVCYKVYGYTPEELTGKVGYEYLVHEDDRHIIIEKNKSRIEGKTDSYEARGKKRTGETIWLKMSGSPMRDANGEVIGSVGIIDDISHSKSLMEQLLATQKMDAIGLLAGGVAHDFNNLLGIIMGYAEDIHSSLPSQSPLMPEAEEIVKACKQASILTHQLLSFSRSQILQPIALNLSESVSNILPLLPRLIGSEIAIETILANDLDKVKADPSQLDQVIVNLALNAKNAMPKGGKLTIETAGAEIDEDSGYIHPDMKPGHYLTLSVSDTGCGMTKEIQSRIFEPFFTTQEMGKGLGLGLSTVYGIVQQSEGYIQVISKPGIGTKMKIFLPADYSQSEPKLQPKQELTGYRELILIVDDDESLGIMVKNMVEKKGYRTEVVLSPTVALAAIENGLRPDLVITDVVMPEMNGKEMVDRIFGIIPGQKVLFMSGFTDNAVVRNGVKNHDFPFIQKPFSYRDIIDLIHKLLLKPQEPVKRTAAILMLDDDENIRELVKRSCAKRGHSFVGAGNLEEALTSLSTQEFDILLVDLQLIGMSGIKALQKIREAGFTTPAIILSGSPGQIDDNFLIPLGVTKTIEKSADNLPLVLCIEELLAGKH